MGLYTTFYLTGRLRGDIPQQVWTVLTALIEDPVLAETLRLPEHEFFSCERWTSVAGGDSWIMPDGDFQIDGYLKDYDSETHKFVDWLMPYIVEGAYGGFIWQDEADYPIHL